jgi:hypothetical protein
MFDLILWSFVLALTPLLLGLVGRLGSFLACMLDALHMQLSVASENAIWGRYEDSVGAPRSSIGPARPSIRQKPIHRSCGFNI